MHYLDDLMDSVFDHFPKTGQNKIELLELSKIIHFLSPKNIMEIGTQHGGTFYLLSKLATGKRISVDLVDGIHGGIDIESAEKRNYSLRQHFSDNVYLLNADSHDKNTFRNVQDILGDEKLDLLFIDGDHSYNGVRQDFEMYRRLVRSAGLIIFHDINFMPNDPTCEVYKFWNELLECKEFEKHWKYEINCKCSWTDRLKIQGGIGVIYI